VFRELDNFLVYYFGEAGFSDFADEPAEDASRVAVAGYPTNTAQDYSLLQVW
jgi:hypothetical protein